MNCLKQTHFKMFELQQKSNFNRSIIANIFTIFTTIHYNTNEILYIKTVIIRDLVLHEENITSSHKHLSSHLKKSLNTDLSFIKGTYNNNVGIFVN